MYKIASVLSYLVFDFSPLKKSTQHRLLVCEIAEKRAIFAQHKSTKHTHCGMKNRVVQ